MSVITVENLGKKYRIRHQQANGARYKALRDVLADAGKSVVRGPWSLTRRLWSVVRSPSFSVSASQHSSVSKTEDFWALKDVSFEVKQGEVLGIIGRNGAGKSTLLKILSRITEPTAGRVRIRGRVASLLEVGTGFHPELTGRENIFLNGAILGMTKAEISTKFDEIAAFSEVEKFLDTPVKRYSSGMYVRLAFSVAAHLEPEILIVDEVLAVGDSQFQRKCLGKMQSVSAREGRTVLFVSHNMGAVSKLCTKALLLRSGYVAHTGKTGDVVSKYMTVKQDSSDQPLELRTDRKGSGYLRFTALHMAVSGQQDSVLAQTGSSVSFDMDFVVTRPISAPVFYLSIYDELGGLLIEMNTRSGRISAGNIQFPGRATCRVDRLPLRPGTYFVNIAAEDRRTGILDWVENARTIQVNAGDYYGTGEFSSERQALFLVDHSWAVRSIAGQPRQTNPFL